jgi:hypothetical protein
MTARNKKTGRIAGLLSPICLLVFCAALQAPAARAEGAQPPKAAEVAHASAKLTAAAPHRKKSPARYYVEFRSRTARSYGHTYLVYGRVSGRRHILGLHAVDPSSSTFMLAHFAPVPGVASASPGDGDERFVTARYRVEMSKAEYRRMAAYIRHLRETKHTWQLTGYNCNAFAGDVARFMGMRAPNPLEMPRLFISHLRAMNDPRQKIAAVAFPYRPN